MLSASLPWVLAVFHDVDRGWLVAQSRMVNLQNRLGFLVSLGLQLQKPGAERDLRELLGKLEESRLAAEDTLCHISMRKAERDWVVRRRPASAAHWYLVSALTVEELTHAA